MIWVSWLPQIWCNIDLGNDGTQGEYTVMDWLWYAIRVVILWINKNIIDG